MTSPFAKSALWTVALAVSTALAAAPAPAAERVSRETILKELETNRAMLSRYNAEYALLKQFERDKSPLIRKELEGLKYKIEALREETQRLNASLDEDERAGEFLKDVVANATMTGAAGSAAPGSEGPTHALHEKALALVSEKRLEEAAVVYEEILLADPEDDQAYLILGHVRLLSGEYQKAEEAFLNAVHIEPDTRDEIVPFYENLALQDPTDDVMQSNLGYACLIAGDVTRAKEAFRSALQIQPSNTAALHGLEIAEGV